MKGSKATVWYPKKVKKQGYVKLHAVNSGILASSKEDEVCSNICQQTAFLKGT